MRTTFICEWPPPGKNWFFDRAFYVTIVDADIGSLKSLHTLFDKYLDRVLVKFEWSELYKNFSFFTKLVNHFWQSVDAILEDVSLTETFVRCWTINSYTIIFQCSKNYSSPKRVTRLKVTPSMADPISLTENGP